MSYPFTNSKLLFLAISQLKTTLTVSDEIEANILNNMETIAEEFRMPIDPIFNNELDHHKQLQSLRVRN